MYMYSYFTVAHLNDGNVTINRFELLIRLSVKMIHLSVTRAACSKTYSRFLPGDYDILGGIGHSDRGTNIEHEST